MKYILLLVLVIGCKADCSDTTRTVDIVPGDAFFNTNVALLNAYQKNGYDCQGKSIRDSSGREVGTSYTCTKCD